MSGTTKFSPRKFTLSPRKFNLSPRNSILSLCKFDRAPCRDALSTR
jgi:hypothetical protein